MRPLSIAAAAALLASAASVQAQTTPPAPAQAAPAHAISVPTAPQLPYVAVAPPEAPRETPFGGVAGIARSVGGRLFVYQRTPAALLEFDEHDRFVRQITYAPIIRAHSVRVDPDGNLWLVDVGAHTVTKMSASGSLLLTLGSPGVAGNWNGSAGTRLLNQPTDVAFGPGGEVYISAGHGGADPRVMRFEKDGRFIASWSLAHDDGSPANIHTIAVDRAGNVYAGDREAMKIRVFDQNGQPLRDIQMRNLVCGLYFDASGNLWMTAGEDGMIMRLNRSGRVLAWTGHRGAGPNEYGEAHYMAMTPDGAAIYVSDPVNGRVQKLVRQKVLGRY